MMLETRRTLLIAIIMTLALCLGCGGSQSVVDEAKVGITYIVHHPLLEEAREGFMEVLKEEGYVEGENLEVDFQSAQGEILAANQIISDFLGRDVDLIYTISTPSTKAAVEKTKTVPIVFAAVTDPVGAGIVSDMEEPGGNVTGTSDFIGQEQHFRFFRLVVPAAKRIGIPYNPGEPSAASSVELLRTGADEAGVEILTASCPNTAAVAEAVASLVERVDAIYIVPDNTLAAAINVVADICSRRGIPMLSSESATVKEGKALASLTVDHHQLGRDAGKMAVSILRGEKPGEIPVMTIKEPAIHVNRSIAERLGITFSEASRPSLTFVE